MKAWNERRLFTEDQIVAIQPNETGNGIVIQINEVADESIDCRLYLNYEDATFFANQIIGFIEDNRVEEDVAVEYNFGF